MLTSFFGSSKPVTLIIVIIYMIVAFFLANIESLMTNFDLRGVGQILGLGLVYIFTMFVLNFVAQKNDLTKRNAYKIILFAAFTAIIPTALQAPKVLLGGLFVLLAMRRIISLRSGRAVERKIFDAAFWLAIATLYYFWSVLFYGILFFGILTFVPFNIRYWVIPFIGALCVAIFTTCYTLYIQDDVTFIWSYAAPESFDFSGYNDLSVLVAIAFFIAVSLWTIFNYLRAYRYTGLKQRPVYILICCTAIVAVLITILAPDKDGSEWYFFIPALCVIVANYLEKASGHIFKQLFLGAILVLPFIILLL